MYYHTYILSIENPTTMNYKLLELVLSSLTIFFLSINLYASEWGKEEKIEPKLFNV